MTKLVKSAAMIMLMISAAFNTSAQTNKFSLSVNSLTTNFYYGRANADLKPYKKNYQGLQAGVAYQAGISPLFSVVPELYFTTKGGILKKSNPLTGDQSILRINSLMLPVVARLHLNKLYLNAGPYAGYNIGGRIKTGSSGTAGATSAKISFGNAPADFSRWDFGAQAGAGCNFSLNKSVLTIDVRYGYGLVNMTPDVDRYNRMLTISVQVSGAGTKSKTKK